MAVINAAANVTTTAFAAAAAVAVIIVFVPDTLLDVDDITVETVTSRAAHSNTITPSRAYTAFTIADGIIIFGYLFSTFSPSPSTPSSFFFFFYFFFYSRFDNF